MGPTVVVDAALLNAVRNQWVDLTARPSGASDVIIGLF